MSDCTKAQSLGQRIDDLETEIKAALKADSSFEKSDIQNLIKEIEDAKVPYLLKIYVPPQMVPPPHRRETLELESQRQRLTVMIRVVSEVYPNRPSGVQAMLEQLFQLRSNVEERQRDRM